MLLRKARELANLPRKVCVTLWKKIRRSRTPA